MVEEPGQADRPSCGMPYRSLNFILKFMKSGRGILSGEIRKDLIKKLVSVASGR